MQTRKEPGSQSPGNTHWLMLVVCLLAVVALTACSRIELAETNPADVRLSGTWILDESASDPTPNLRDGLRNRRQGRGPQEIRQREIRGALGSGLSFIVHDFQVLSAQRLRIELNHDSMGIDYEPGVYRDVSWGLRERNLWEVYAGWEMDELVIISTANEMRVVERLKRRGDELRVSIDIKADDESRKLVRVFQRADG